MSISIHKLLVPYGISFKAMQSGVTLIDTENGIHVTHSMLISTERSNNGTIDTLPEYWMLTMSCTKLRLVMLRVDLRSLYPSQIEHRTTTPGQFAVRCSLHGFRYLPGVHIWKNYKYLTKYSNVCKKFEKMLPLFQTMCDRHFRPINVLKHLIISFHDSFHLFHSTQYCVFPKRKKFRKTKVHKRANRKSQNL